MSGFPLFSLSAYFPDDFSLGERQPVCARLVKRCSAEHAGGVGADDVSARLRAVIVWEEGEGIVKSDWKRAIIVMDDDSLCLFLS